MSERPVKRLRRLSTEEDDTSGNDDWIPDELKNKAGGIGYGKVERHVEVNNPRARRGVAVPTSATVRHTSPSSSSTGQRSIRLTVKAPPSKLREVTMGSPPDTKPSRSAAKSRDSLSRGSKNKAPVIEEDEDDDDDLDAGGEDDTPTPAPPPSKTKTSPNKPTLSFRIPKKPGTETKKPLPEQVLKATPRAVSVEDKEMALAASDDEELSELEDEDVERDDEEQEEEHEEDDDDENEEEEEDDDPDAEGEEYEEEDADHSALPSALDQLTAAADGATSPSPSLSDSELGSRSGTPDPNRLTRRQRGGPEGMLMALSNEAQKKKFLTAEQLTMRRAEMARRRKDLSEKRAKEEKEDTLKRLLEKPQPKKKKGDDMGESGEEGEKEVERARAGWVRIVHGVGGTRLGVPDEWLEAPVGRVFEGSRKMEGLRVVGGTRLVQEVE